MKPANIYKQSPKKAVRQGSVAVDPDANVYDDCNSAGQYDALHNRLDVSEGWVGMASEWEGLDGCDSGGQFDALHSRLDVSEG